MTGETKSSSVKVWTGEWIIPESDHTGDCYFFLFCIQRLTRVGSECTYQPPQKYTVMRDEPRGVYGSICLSFKSLRGPHVQPDARPDYSGSGTLPFSLRLPPSPLSSVGQWAPSGSMPMYPTSSVCSRFWTTPTNPSTLARYSTYDFHNLLYFGWFSVHVFPPVPLLRFVG